jgi:N-acylneuraminate cytidylyltransferase/CMP-N,N'-diacetyllegionaminic acid synthase
MIKGKKILTLIPAKGESKGLPGKNIMNLEGKPLIAWTIETAKKCEFIDKLVVSTEDKEIKEISEEVGAVVPFIRPKELASDAAKANDVIFHAIEWFENKNEFFDLILVLQPTSPLRIKEDIINSINQLFEFHAKAVISVSAADHHPFWMNTLPADKSMKNFLPTEALNANRQDLQVFYRLNGAIYLAFIEYFKENRGFWGDKTFAYIMPKERSVDIDDIIDFRLAAVLLKKD